MRRIAIIGLLPIFLAQFVGCGESTPAPIPASEIPQSADYESSDAGYTRDAYDSGTQSADDPYGRPQTADTGGESAKDELAQAGYGDQANDTSSGDDYDAYESGGTQQASGSGGNASADDAVGYASSDAVGPPNQDPYGGQNPYGDAAQSQQDGGKFYDENVHAILQAKCFRCHSSQSPNPKAGLSMDTSRDLQLGSDERAVVVGNDPDKSPLIQVLREGKMPPKEPKLTSDEIDVLTKWVSMGTPYGNAGGGVAANNPGNPYGDGYGNQGYGNAGGGGGGYADEGYGQEAGYARGNNQYPYGNNPGDRSQQREPPKPQTLAEKSDDAFRKGNDPAAFGYMYASLLSDDEAAKTLVKNYAWVSGLQRPTIAVRWGVGMDYTVKDHEGDPKPIGNNDQGTGVSGGRGGSAGTYGEGGYGAGGGGGGGFGDDDFGPGGYGNGPDNQNGDRPGRQQITYYSGEVGDKFLDKLEARIQRGYFGKLLEEKIHGLGSNNTGSVEGSAPYGGNPYGGVGDAYEGGYNGPGYGGNQSAGVQSNVEYPQLMVGTVSVGEGTQEELIENAKEAGVDVLAVIDVDVSIVKRTGYISNNTRLRIIDVMRGKELASLARPLNNRKVEVERERQGQAEGRTDVVDAELDKLFKRIDSTCKVGEIPEGLNTDIAKKRVVSLATAEYDNPLPALAEIRFYQERGLITAPMLAKAYKRLVGDEIGTALSTGDAAKRESALADWMPTKSEPKPPPSNPGQSRVNDADPNLGGPPKRNLKPL